MLDYQRIVDDVRNALLNNGQEGRDFLQAAAADYSLAVDEVNESLRKCTAFLRKGLRSEALQLCEIEEGVNLLDVVAMLDFPERETWNELLKMHDIMPPALLLVEGAADLNEAYAIEQPLAALLQRHRLLALRRAPLRKRINVLRGLNEADPENPVWEKDLLAFEEVRLKEVQEEVAQAIAASDSPAMIALTSELENEQWRTRPPESLLQQLVAARSKLARQEGLAEMRRVSDHLNQAHAAFDVDLGRRVRERWDQLEAVWNAGMDKDLIERVAPALDWLREQDEIDRRESQHAAAIAALEHAISASKSTDEVEHLYRQVNQNGDLPAGVENLYRAYLAKRELAIKRRVHWTLAAFAAVVLGTVGLGVALAIQKQYVSQVDTAVQTIDQLLDEGRTNDARVYLDQLRDESPAVFGEPEIEKRNKLVDDRLKTEDTRRRAFLAAVAAAQKSIEAELPDKDAMTRTGNLAASEDERAIVRKLMDAVTEIEGKIRTKNDQEFIKQLTEIKDRIDKVEVVIEEKPESSGDKLNGLIIELTKLEDNSPKVTDDARKPAILLRARLKALIEEVGHVSERQRLEEKMTEMVDNATQFRAQLAEYARKHPTWQRSSSFVQVSEESPLWDWLAQWNAMVRAIGRQGITKLDSKAAAEVAARLAKLLDDRTGHPDAETIRSCLPYLEAIARRLDGNGKPIAQSLNDYPFTHEYMTKWFMLTDVRGNRYYVSNETAVARAPRGLDPNTTYGVDYYVDTTMTIKATTLLGRDIADMDPAPQQAIAQKVTPLLDSVNNENWESVFCRIFLAIHASTEVDPVLRVVLLKKVMASGCQGSHCLQKVFGPDLAAIVPAGANWCDPFDPAGKKFRVDAEVELRNVGDIKAKCYSVGTNWRKLSTPIGTEYSRVGWLRRKPDGKWQCMAKNSLLDEGTKKGKAFIARAANSTGNKRADVLIEPVGQLQDGVITIDAKPGPSLLEGRPVYLAIPPSN